MAPVLLEIGCDGGSITLKIKEVINLLLYQVISSETFVSDSNTVTFLTLQDAWSFLTKRYPKWYQLYLVQITTQMTELVKKDYILAPDKNKYTMDVWLLHLTGRGIGF